MEFFAARKGWILVQAPNSPEARSIRWKKSLEIGGILEQQGEEVK